MESKETGEKNRSERRADEPAGEEDENQTVSPTSEKPQESSEPSPIRVPKPSASGTKAIQCGLQEGVVKRSASSPLRSTSSQALSDSEIPSTSGTRRSPTPLHKTKSTASDDKGKLAKLMTFVRSTVLRSDVPADEQRSPSSDKAADRGGSGQEAPSTTATTTTEQSLRSAEEELARPHSDGQNQAEGRPSSSGKDARAVEQGQAVGDGAQAQALTRPDAAGARAELYRAIFGNYWPIFTWLFVVIDGEIENLPWRWCVPYYIFFAVAFILLIQGIRLIWILISTLLMTEFTLELYFVTILAYTTAHGFFSRILLHKFAKKGRYRKAVEQLHEFLREKTFKCRGGWLNAWCIFLSIFLIANGAFYPFVALWDLTSKNAADQFVKPILSFVELTSPWWFVFDAISLFFFGTLPSVALIIGLFLTKSALSEAVDMYKNDVDGFLNELSPAMPDEDVVTKLRTLHEHLIELMELSRRMYGGDGKDAFHVTFLCFMSVILPSQSAIPFVFNRASQEPMFYMHLALLLSWFFTGLVVTISILVWLLKPVKEIAKLKVTLRLSKSLNLRTHNDIHLLVNRMVLCMDDTGVNPLSNKRVFFSSPFLALALLSVPFIVGVLNMPAIPLTNPASSSLLPSRIIAISPK